MDAVLWLSVIVAGLAVVTWISRRAVRRERSRCPESEALYPECLHVVQITEQWIAVSRPDGASVNLPLADLTKVVVETNDSGPWGADVLWHWYGSSLAVVCSYPQGATGESAALAFLESLRGFNDHELRKAMGCTSNRTFTVYERAA